MIWFYDQPDICAPPLPGVFVDDLREHLMQVYEQFPEGARLYNGSVCEANEIHILDMESVDRLSDLEGDVYLVHYPQGPILAVALIVAIQVGQYLLQKPPKKRRNRPTSPNNQLGERTNEPRINERIEDIFGTVRSTPTMISFPYFVYENNTQVEYSFMCIGRGAYATSEWKDGDTKLESISGAGVEVYGPNTSPNSGTPELTIGSDIAEYLYAAQRSNSVTGQLLRAPNNDTFSSSLITFSNNVDCNIHEDADTDFDAFFTIGDNVVVSGAQFTGNLDPSGTIALDLDGTFEVAAVDAETLTFSNPGAINADWDQLNNLIDNTSPFVSTQFSELSDKWIGWFTLDFDGITEVLCNFYAPNGLWKIPTPKISTLTGQPEAEKQYAIDVTVKIEVREVDASETPTGNTTSATDELLGSRFVQSARSLTVRVPIPGGWTTSKVQVRIKRVTDSPPRFDGQLQDAVEWRDLYAMRRITTDHFGDVTTVHSKTLANTGSSSIKARKLNAIVTRKIPRLTSGSSTVPTTLTASSHAGEIFAAMCVDPLVGRRSLAELDLVNIFAVVDDVEAHFGTSSVTEFGITFDDEDMSFEESLAIVADAIHCRAFRQGSRIGLKFEGPQTVSRLVFNHRNKLPGTEQRTVAFGTTRDFDGVELEYVDLEDGMPKTYYVPEDQTAGNPQRIEQNGIRGKLAARFHAYRAYNKSRRQHVGVEFEATEAATTITRGDRILVADNTRPDTQDGDVLAQSGLTLTLSQPVSIAEASTIFLQLMNGSVDAMGVTQIGDRTVSLSRAPISEISTSTDNVTRCQYWIVPDSSSREQTFLVAEKESTSRFTYRVEAVNYDERYYENDLDFINGVVDEDGELI